MYANPNCFGYYNGGIALSTSTCPSNPIGSDGQPLINHAVTIVGYAELTTNTQCSGYWIVKNSWGTNWAEQGYVKLCIRTTGTAGTCNVNYQISYPDMGLIKT